MPELLTIDDQGVVPAFRQVPSPNCDARPAGVAIELIVIHNISLPPGEFGGDAVERLFTNTLDCDSHPYYGGLRGVRVSAHFLLRRDGSPTQFVACGRRAWHAGESSWRGRTACNDFSIGIELEGSDELPFAEAQYAALKDLLSALKARYPIAGIAGHCDIAPSRKTDPGPHFDWPRVRGT
jgi:N-acetyl-anhydromuramoyl-L-alanine amidase